MMEMADKEGLHQRFKESQEAPVKSHRRTRSLLDLIDTAQNAAEHAEQAVRKIIEAGWKVCHFDKLPEWLKDNDYLRHGHRPPLPSFGACFKSIFRLHTETANIWTHLLGFVASISLTFYTFLCSIQTQEKLVFGIYLLCASICLAFSFLFHTLSCHSNVVNRIFAKLDYCGIAVLIMGSYVPWLYYSFYCHFKPKLVYLTGMSLLGITTIIISMWDKFSEPDWRSLRASVFLIFGLSAIVPAIHYYAFIEELSLRLFHSNLCWLLVTGCLYVCGACLYAFRIPERFFRGKFDIWLHSHQIFHVFVLSGAFVYLHGLSEIADLRLTVGHCIVN